MWIRNTDAGSSKYRSFAIERRRGRLVAVFSRNRMLIDAAGNLFCRIPIDERGLVLRIACGESSGVDVRLYQRALAELAHEQSRTHPRP